MVCIHTAVNVLVKDTILYKLQKLLKQHNNI